MVRDDCLFCVCTGGGWTGKGGYSVCAYERACVWVGGGRGGRGGGDVDISPLLALPRDLMLLLI